MSEAIYNLRRELRTVSTAVINEHPQGSLFDAFIDRFATEGRARAATNAPQRVVDEWLIPALERAPSPWLRLAELIGLAAPELPWFRSYENLEPSPELASFQPHYSYQLFAAPAFRGHAPPVVMNDLLVGFTLQAPHVLYPAHHHQPAEMYGVISGTLEWQIGDSWSTVGPGDVVVHRSHESHAMRTLDEPALTWVIWPEHPDHDVYMPSLDPPAKSMNSKKYL